MSRIRYGSDVPWRDASRRRTARACRGSFAATRDGARRRDRAAKTATVACAVDAFIHADSPRLRGKGIRTRAVGIYRRPAARARLEAHPEPGRYPRALDLAVTVPLLLDAGGNALGKYQEAHVDDLVHVANAAIVSGVVGALAAPNVDERWQAAAIGAGVAVAGATAWELMEYGAMQLGADGMDLTYEDTMADLPRAWSGDRRLALHLDARAAVEGGAGSSRLAGAARVAQTADR